MKIPEYIITISKYKVESISVQQCYQYLLNKLAEHLDLSVATEQETDTVDDALDSLVSELLDLNSKYQPNNHMLKIILALRSATVDNDEENRALINEAIIAYLRKLPTTIPEIEIAQALIELNNVWDSKYYSFEIKDAADGGNTNDKIWCNYLEW